MQRLAMPLQGGVAHLKFSTSIRSLPSSWICENRQYLDRDRSVQPSIARFVDDAHAASPKQRKNLVRAKLLADQRLGFFFRNHLGCQLQGRLFNETVSTTIIELEQGLHFLTQFFVAGTSVFKKTRPLTLFQLQSL